MDIHQRPESSYSLSDFIAQGRRSINAINAQEVTNNDELPAMVAPTTRKFKMSKRVNARLQLAAALIEADNDELEQRAQFQQNFVRATLRNSQIEILPALPSIPLPKHASESVIFAPYRESADTDGDQGSGGAGLDSEGRPVIDFLGVKLPTEKRYSQATSLQEEEDSSFFPKQHRNRPSVEWQQKRTSWSGSLVRPQSAMSRSSSQGLVGQTGPCEEEVLGGWGVDKFLSSEAREKIESGRQSRANSVNGIERPQSVASDYSAMGGRSKAQSEVGTSVSSRMPVDEEDKSKLDLLTKIKMYREAQREESGDVDVVFRNRSDDDEMNHEFNSESEGIRFSDPLQHERKLSVDRHNWNGHLEALTKADGSNVGIVSQAKSAVIGPEFLQSMTRSKSNRGVTGECWSDQGDETFDNSTSLSHAMSKINEMDKTRAVSDFSGAQPIDIALPPPRIDAVMDAENDNHIDGMAGIGSFSRSPRSRGNSVSSNNQLPGTSSALGDTLPLGSSLVESTEQQRGRTNPRPQSTFLSKPNSPGFLDGTMPRSSSNPSLLSPTNQIQANSRSTSPFRSSMLNPAFSPRLKAQSEDIISSIDPYSELMSGYGPYPALNSLDIRFMDNQEDPYKIPSTIYNQGRSDSKHRTSMQGLTTKQIQELSKQNSFLSSYGMGSQYGTLAGLPDEDADLLKAEDELFHAEEGLDGGTFSPPLQSPQLEEESQLKSERKRWPSEDDQDVTIRPLEAFVGASEEPDLSSARWGRKKRKSLLATKVRNRLSAAMSMNSINPTTDDIMAGGDENAMDDDIDDDYTSPPVRGPLKPRGLENRLPKMLSMPQPLQGTSSAKPQSKVLEAELANKRWTGTAKGAIHVPDGFTLHHSKRESLSMKALKVQGASGAKPFFMSPGGKQKHDQLVGDFLNSISAERVIQIPSVAPSGIGRRAAMNTTALFRNQLVQHEEEKEGWGWEASNPIGTELKVVVEEDEDESGLPSIGSGGGGMTDLIRKRKEKKKLRRIQKEKQKRKEARRVRRQARRLAIDKNIPFEEAGVEEFSPDEDLYLSDSSSGHGANGVGGDGEDGSDSDVSWNSRDEERWVDEKKPAGKLYGKSLLDVMDERKKIKTDKVRQYGNPASELILGDDQSIVANSVGAFSFRDNPIGYNDTRERMEAAFGPDPIWEKEMAKRRVLDAKEAEITLINRLAKEELEAEDQAEKEKRREKKMKAKAKKEARKVVVKELEISAPIIEQPIFVDTVEEQVEEGATNNDQRDSEEQERSRTPVNPPTINLELPSDSSLTRKSSFAEAASAWLDDDDDDDDNDGSSNSEDSEAEAELRRQGLQRDRMARSVPVPNLAATLSLHEMEESEESSEEDDVPLSQLRSKMRPPVLGSHRSYNRRSEESSDDDEEEEEVPLAQLVAKRKEKSQSLGTLNIDFDVGTASSSLLRGAVAHAGENEGKSDDDDDRPLGLKVANSDATFASLMAKTNNNGGDEEDDDDRPLGAAHPQAAIIAEQAYMIQQLQTELIVKQQHQQQQQMMAMNPYGFNPHMSFMAPAPAPAASFLGVYPTTPMTGMPMPMSPQVLPPLHPERGASIANWASQVPKDATASGSHSRASSAANY